VGGPEQLSYNELLAILADVMGRKKSLLHIPMGLMMPAVKALEKTGLSPVTSDQLGLLSRDSTCAPDAVRKEFGFEPVAYRRAIELSTLRREPGR
jgi:NADH dehydrogenase